MSKTQEIGESDYQIDCRRYYNAYRQMHSDYFTQNQDRKNQELYLKRYDSQHNEINNLFSFVGILHQLLIDRKNVRGMDYGCGSHYFVDYVVEEYGWDAYGYDSDDVAITIAKINYKNTENRYFQADLLKSRIPLQPLSMDFVFCNSVIQHFDSRELEFSITDMYRVLKKGGILNLIFKNNFSNVVIQKINSSSKIHLINHGEGKFELIEILEQSKNISTSPSELYINRLLHFFSVEELLEIARRNDFKIATNLKYKNTIFESGIISFTSGRGIPSVAVFLTK